jgi:hypothetical protein
MIHRETQTTKTIRDSFHGLLLMGGQQEWRVTKMLIYDGVADGRGATRELIFRCIYYMLNNVVNLVKYGVFILLVVVMFF